MNQLIKGKGLKTYRKIIASYVFALSVTSIAMIVLLSVLS